MIRDVMKEKSEHGSEVDKREKKKDGDEMKKNQFYFRFFSPLTGTFLGRQNCPPSSVTESSFLS